MEDVRSLPYLNAVTPNPKDQHKNGVSRHLPGKSVQGLNFYNYEGYARAFLMDMSGKELHSWDAGELVFNHAELLPNGDVLGIDWEAAYLFKVDLSSRLEWKVHLKAHHDLAVADNGDIITLTEGGGRLPQFHKEKVTVENWIAVLTDDGTTKHRIAISRLLLGAGIPLQTLKAVIHRNVDSKAEHDAFHTNTLEIIREDVLAGGKKVLRKGQVLICIRNLDLVCVVDLEREKIVWSWGMDQLQRPHQPSMLSNGNILIFDNGSHRGYSRLQELDPRTKKVVWQYRAPAPRDFFVNTSGGCQGLLDGNVLVTDSLRARVFEVARKGETVWEFYSQLSKKSGDRRVIWRMSRLTDPAKFPALKRFWRSGSQPR